MCILTYKLLCGTIFIHDEVHIPVNTPHSAARGNSPEGNHRHGHALLLFGLFKRSIKYISKLNTNIWRIFDRPGQGMHAARVRSACMEIPATAYHSLQSERTAGWGWITGTYKSCVTFKFR